jgi:hypothetical protein
VTPSGKNKNHANGRRIWLASLGSTEAALFDPRNPLIKK